MIHSGKRKINNVWETKEESIKSANKLLKKALRIDNPEAIYFADVHRLPQHPVVKNGKNITRPMIILLSNSFNKHQIIKCLKNQAYNNKLNPEPKQPDYAYITV